MEGRMLETCWEQRTIHVQKNKASYDFVATAVHEADDIVIDLLIDFQKVYDATIEVIDGTIYLVVSKATFKITSVALPASRQSGNWMFERSTDRLMAIFCFIL
jgi:hypothetical protein